MNSAAILEKLVSFPTVSRVTNAPLIDWAADFLRANGCEVEILNGPEGKKNLWARKGPEQRGGMALVGHTDVVPTEGQPWSHDPFCLIEREGALYGRGACDMKGFLAVALRVMAQTERQKLSKPLYLGLTYDEETDMAGAQHLADWLIAKDIRPDWLWLGEPTEMEVVTCHKGSCSFQGLFGGVASHSSLPDKGLNAIDMAIKFGLWIEEKARAKRAPSPAGSIFDPPCTTMNIGLIEGGKAVNIIPDSCRIGWGYRFVSDEDDEEIQRDLQAFLRDLLADAQRRFPQAFIKMERQTRFPLFRAPPDHPSIGFLCARTGCGSPRAAPYTTEAGFYQKTGASVLICGPGSITKAHQADECVPLADLDSCETLMRESVRRSTRNSG